MFVNVNGKAVKAYLYEGERYFIGLSYEIAYGLGRSCGSTRISSNIKKGKMVYNVDYIHVTDKEACRQLKISDKIHLVTREGLKKMIAKNETEETFDEFWTGQLYEDEDMTIPVIDSGSALKDKGTVEQKKKQEFKKNQEVKTKKKNENNENDETEIEYDEEINNMLLYTHVCTVTDFGHASHSKWPKSAA